MGDPICPVCGARVGPISTTRFGRPGEVVGILLLLFAGGGMLASLLIWAANRNQTGLGGEQVRLIPRLIEGAIFAAMAGAILVGVRHVWRCVSCGAIVERLKTGGGGK